MSARGRRPARPSSSPEGSDGNDTSSAPSEFLAEFLSAIMRRQYAEALKYCRLILQYEPQNTAARGFYPLLVRRAAHRAPHTDTTPSDGTSGSSLEVDSSSTSASGTREELDDVEDDDDLNGNALFRTNSYTGATLLVDENDNAAAATAPPTPGRGRRPRR